MVDVGTTFLLPNAKSFFSELTFFIPTEVGVGFLAGTECIKNLHPNQSPAAGLLILAVGLGIDLGEGPEFLAIEGPLLLSATGGIEFLTGTGGFQGGGLS